MTAKNDPAAASAAFMRLVNPASQSGGASGQPPAMQFAGPSSQPVIPFDEGDFLKGRGSKWRPAEKQWFRLDEGYIAEAKRYIEAGLFAGQYQSRADLYRHAIVIHLERVLPGWVGEVEGSVLHQLQQIGEICAKEEFELRYVQMIDRIGATIASILELPGGKLEVGNMLRRILKHIALMRPGFYKGYFGKMFNDRFAVYLASGLVMLEMAGQDEDETATSMPDDLLGLGGGE